MPKFDDSGNASDRSQPSYRILIINENEESEVDNTVLHRKSGLDFHVRWKGQNAPFDAWEPQSNLAQTAPHLNTCGAQARPLEGKLTRCR